MMLIDVIACVYVGGCVCVLVFFCLSCNVNFVYMSMNALITVY